MGGGKSTYRITCNWEKTHLKLIDRCLALVAPDLGGFLAGRSHSWRRQWSGRHPAWTGQWCPTWQHDCRTGDNLIFFSTHPRDHFSRVIERSRRICRHLPEQRRRVSIDRKCQSLAIQEQGATNQSERKTDPDMESWKAPEPGWGKVNVDAQLHWECWVWRMGCRF